MRYICKSFKPNKGTSKDKQTGKEFSWDNINIQCEVVDDNPKAVQPVGENWREIISVKNDFNSVVITNGLKVDNFYGLLGCEIRPLYNRWGKVQNISIVAIDGKF